MPLGLALLTASSRRAGVEMEQRVEANRPGKAAKV
jgi:hypothetical protein